MTYTRAFEDVEYREFFILKQFNLFDYEKNYYDRVFFSNILELFVENFQTSPKIVSKKLEIIESFI